MDTNFSHIWHRCGTCGSIYADLKELRAHQNTHQSQKRSTPKVTPRPTPLPKKIKTSKPAINPTT
ncbi:MAG TPA: hypothetical protein VFD70_17285 [Anaerolineae bacterium]|nr:hypothetical protein [Anaerolineae bacterium]